MEPQMCDDNPFIAIKFEMHTDTIVCKYEVFCGWTTLLVLKVRQIYIWYLSKVKKRVLYVYIYIYIYIHIYIVQYRNRKQIHKRYFVKRQLFCSGDETIDIQTCIRITARALGDCFYDATQRAVFCLRSITESSFVRRRRNSTQRLVSFLKTRFMTVTLSAVLACAVS